MLKLIDDENEEIKFQDKVKQFPIVNFLLEFLTWVNRSKKKKTRGTVFQGRTCWAWTRLFS